MQAASQSMYLEPLDPFVSWTGNFVLEITERL